MAPDGIRAYFGELFAAFPDFALEVVELTTARHRTAVRWQARGTFAGPGSFQGFAPNHARVHLEGCDVISVEDELIVHNDAYIDSGDLARQLGLLPAAGSPSEARLTRLANARTRVMRARHGVSVEPVADGVWVVRGGFPLKTHERLSHRRRRRRDRVRRRDPGHGRRRWPRSALSTVGRAGWCSAMPMPTIAARRPRWACRSSAIRANATPPSRTSPCATTGTWASCAPTRGPTSSGCSPPGTAARWRSRAPSPRATRWRGSRSWSSPATLRA